MTVEVVVVVVVVVVDVMDILQNISFQVQGSIP